MIKGAFIINAFYFSKPMRDMIDKLTIEFNKLGITMEVLSNKQIHTYVDDSGIRNNLQNISFVYYMDKDVYIAEMLAKSGLLVINSPESIRLSDDKMLTHIVLGENKIPTTKSISSPLCYKEGGMDFLDGVEKEIAYPMVVKENFGSLGMQVYLIRNRVELENTYRKLKNVKHIYQPYIDYEIGTDYRVIVIGGKAVAYMKRHNPYDFRSNLEQMGQGYVIPEDKKMLELAERGAKALKLDYAGVDLLKTKEDVYVINEINPNAFMLGIEKVTGKNVAKTLVLYLYDKYLKTLQ